VVKCLCNRHHEGAGGASCQGWQLCAAWNKCFTAAALKKLMSFLDPLKMLFKHVPVLFCQPEVVMNFFSQEYAVY
jgi:hypothetical protein